MAAGLGWMSGDTSSLDITIISVLFLIVYITLYTLCTTCFSPTPDCPEEKERPSLAMSMNPEEDDSSTQRTMNNDDDLSSMVHSSMPQVSVGPQLKNHSIVYCQQAHVYSHNRAKSDSFFSLQTRPSIPDTPPFSFRSIGSASSRLPDLPPLPLHVYLTTVQMPAESSPEQQTNEVKPARQCFTPQPETLISGFTETVIDEHPYACLDNLIESRPSSLSPCDEADEDQCEIESPYRTVTYEEWTDSNACGKAMVHPWTDSEKAEELKFIFPPLPLLDDLPTDNTDASAIYAVVNRKNKSPKLQEEASVVQNTTVLDEDEAPPVPKKIFD